MVDNAVIDKIAKLLALANSDNENEAKLAAAKASELLIKHNLTTSEVRRLGNIPYVDNTVLNVGLQLAYHQDILIDLMTDYFFVKCIIQREYNGVSSGQWAHYRRPRVQYNKVITFVGSNENATIAGYVFSYLNDTYPKLWNAYKTSTKAKGKGAKKSYYLGLNTALIRMLEETKWRVQEETGLVLVEDSNLTKHIKDRVGENNNYGGGKTPDKVDKHSFNKGLEDGKNIKLRKSMESTETKTQGLRLNGAK